MMRKEKTFILAVILCVTGVFGSSVYAGSVLGDINGDRKISLEEAVYALQVASGQKSSVAFTLQSNVITAGGEIPRKYACTYCPSGENLSPQLSWSNPPAGTKSFALIMDDPDAVPVAGYTWIHWIVYDIPPDTSILLENAGAQSSSNLPEGAKHGLNSYSTQCGPEFYGGPCPPSGTHRYYFKLFALDVEQLAPANKTKDGIYAAMREHILGEAELMGTFTSE